MGGVRNPASAGNHGTPAEQSFPRGFRGAWFRGSREPFPDPAYPDLSDSLNRGGTVAAQYARRDRALGGRGSGQAYFRKGSVAPRGKTLWPQSSERTLFSSLPPQSHA